MNDKLSPSVNFLCPTIFHEDWWLDVVTQGRYELVEALENGRVIGRLPYFVRALLNVRCAVMPPLTHFLGPAVDEGEGSYNTRFLKRVAVTRELIGKLPSLSCCTIKCHRGVTDIVPFQMENFNSTVQFTHEIHPQPEEQIWKNLSAPRRTIIRGAMKKSVVESLDDPQQFMAFYDNNLKKTGKSSYINSALCAKIMGACLERGRGKIYVTKCDGALTAGIFCVWDETSSYYLTTTRDPSSHSGDVSLLTYHAILEAAEKNIIFDLDGLSDQGGVAFFAGFGGVITPRFLVRKQTRTYRVIDFFRSYVEKENYFTL